MLVFSLSFEQLPTGTTCCPGGKIQYTTMIPPPSHTHTHTEPPAPPLITVAVHNVTAVVVTWDSVTDPIATNYTIEYRQMGGGGVYMSRTVQENTEGSHSEVIGGELDYGSEYQEGRVWEGLQGRGLVNWRRV